MKYKGGDCTDISQDFFNPADEGMASVCAAAGGAECTSVQRLPAVRTLAHPGSQAATDAILDSVIYIEI